MKIIAFDLDDVLCERPTESGGIEKYSHCTPKPEMIEIINKCYDAGHDVIVYTARGMKVFDGNVDIIHKKLYNLTKNQLHEWGIKYNRLVMGKQYYDILIDDKAIFSEEIKNYEDILENIT